jgi:ketosteroid isomerase-like protein
MSATQLDRDDRIRLYFAGADSWDMRAFDQSLSESVRFRFGNAEPIAGLSEVKTLAAQTQSALAGMRHDLHRILHDASGSYATVELTVTYTRHDGRQFTFPAAVVVHFDAGELIDEYRIYVDQGELWTLAT